ncbi:MAG: hypothetical protein ACK4V1_10570 [Burkholderiaceae bacterium]
MDAFEFDVDSLDAAVPLVHHIPQRDGPSLRQVVAAAVTAPAQLPPYLMLGRRDDASFRADADGWSIAWRGMEPKTAFEWRYERATDTNRLSQTWCGLDGGIAVYTAHTPIERAIGTLYQPFPQNWDAAAQSLHSSHFWLAYMPEPGNARSFVGFPDGAFKTIVVPLCADRVERFAGDWIRRVWTANLPVPVSTHLMRIRCDAAYVHGCHGIGADDAAMPLARCERQTGRRPDVAPAHVRVLDGRPAWEIERHLPCAVITVPFAGLTAALLMLDDVGVLTGSREPFALRDDRPDGAAPLVLPAAVGNGLQITLWPRDRSMRVRWTLTDLMPPLDRVPAQGNLH